MNSNKNVLILMSTYNANESLIKQIESIFNQKNVNISLYIRDDGSNSKTKELLNLLSKKYNKKITVVYGDNVGWKKSFLELISSADLTYDYYGFSDQDDIWFEDKVISCIKDMEKDEYDGIKLCHCNSLSVNERLVERNEQEIRIKEPRTHKNAFAMEYFQGCGMLWNQKAMKLLTKKKISNPNISHDFWVGLICYLFGRVYFINLPKFYHIRYDNSQSSDGSVLKGRIKRIKEILTSNNAYMNPSYDLLKNYDNYLDEKDKIFLKYLKNYKNSLNAKIKVLFDKDFSRNSFSSTLLMKIAILFNKY